MFTEIKMSGLGRNEAALGSVASLGMGAYLALNGRAGVGGALVVGGVQGVVYCLGKGREVFKKSEFVREVGLGVMTQAALSTVNIQKHLTSRLKVYVKDSIAQVAGKSMQVMCARAVQQIIRGEMPDLLLVSSAAGLGAAAAETCGVLMGGAISGFSVLIQESLKGGVEGAVQRLTENLFRNRPLAHDILRSALVQSSVRAIQAAPAALQERAQAPMIEEPVHDEVGLARYRQELEHYSEAEAKYKTDLESYNKIKDYWTQLFKPWSKNEFHLAEKVRKILEGKEVTIHAGKALWSYKLGSPVTLPSPPVPLEPLPPHVIAEPSQYPNNLPSPHDPSSPALVILLWDPLQGEKVLVQREPDQEGVAPAEIGARPLVEPLIDQEEEEAPGAGPAPENPDQQRVVAAALPFADLDLEEAIPDEHLALPAVEPHFKKVRKIKAHIERLEKQLKGCSGGKSGRAKRSSLSLQLAVYKEMLVSLKG